MLGVIVATALLVAVFESAASAAPPNNAPWSTQNNIVNLQNNSNNSTLVRFQPDLAIDSSPNVTNENVAEAQASCTTCRTVAVAVQYVIVEGSPSNYQPANAAVAVNQNCTSCQTFAYANQIVLEYPGPVTFDRSYWPQAMQLLGQMNDVAHSSEAFPQMQSDLDSLVGQLTAVAEKAIQPAPSGPSREDQHEDIHAA